MPPSTRALNILVPTAESAPEGSLKDIGKASDVAKGHFDTRVAESSSSQQKRRASSPAVADVEIIQKRTKRKSDPSSMPDTALDSASANSSSLENLPDEILLLILSHVPGHIFSRRATYYNMSLTSRRLNRTANDYLYEWYDARLDHPAKFLKTIFANPDLASHVKSITWELSPEPDDSLPSETKPTSAECRILRESLKSLGIANRAAWVKEYLNGKPDGLLRLALLHAPNLRELSVLDEPSDSYSLHNESRRTSAQKILALILGGVNNLPNGNAPTYCHLHTLQLGIGGLLLGEVFPIFRLPSLRKLTLEEADACPASLDVDTSDARFSSVTHLTIVESFIASATLSVLISACRELKELECSYSYSYTSDAYHGHSHSIDYGIIYRALEQHKHTLERIDLEDISNREMPMLTEYNRNKVGSFRDFPRLRFLGVPFEAFPASEEVPPPPSSTDDESLDDDVSEVRLATLLPPTLKSIHLTVFEDEEHTLECSESLKLLCDNFRPALPVLSEIRVRMHRSVYMRCVDFSNPKYRFQTANVSFDVMQDGVDEEDIMYSDDDEHEYGYDSGMDDHQHQYDYWDEEMSSWDEEEDMIDAIQGDPDLLHDVMTHLFPGGSSPDSWSDELSNADPEEIGQQQLQDHEDGSDTVP